MLPLTGHHGPVTGLAYHPAGRLLASAGWDGSVRLWDVAAARQLDELRTPHPHALAVAFAPDGRSLAAGFRRQPAQESGNAVWADLDPAAGRFLDRRDAWRPHDHDVRALAHHPAGAWLATGGTDGAVRLWRRTPVGPLPLRSFFYTDSPVFGVAADPAGDAVAALGYADGVVSVWDAATGRRQGALHQGAFGHALAFAPAGRLLAAGVGWDVLVWALDGPGAKPRPVHRLVGDREDVLGVAFSPDGRTLFTGDRGGVVTAWDADAGLARARFDWQLGEVRALACSPDGLTVAAGGDGGDVLVWDADPGGW